ncbi:MAG: 3-oxoacyl-[acyl-carrier-protein] reductase [Syntrophomonadaceae bacterium]|nr:3-oxoacyl-[acyl-carrier-protein] reductase [Syntrophomonadaceae bacterium]
MSQPAALVTGSSRGIGRAIAIKLAQDGFQVAINYYNQGDAARNREQAEEVLSAIAGQGGTGIILGADVSTPEGAAGLVEKTITGLGRLDVLVNNAGINKDQLLIRMTDAQWHDVINTNLSSAFYCSKAALKYMMKKKQGRIINISSVVGMAGNAGQAHYAASKAGLLGFTYSVAKEYGPRGITANAVAPGYIESDMTSNLPPEVGARMVEQIPAGRLGKPEDIAAVVAFLASPAAAYINGQVIRVDGGMSI